jgi:hypothetical protein
LTQVVTAEPDVVAVSVAIEKLDQRGPISNWDDGTRLWLSFNRADKTIGIAGNRDALVSLARHCLTLAQDGARPGASLYWAPESGSRRDGRYPDARGWRR